MFSVGGFIKAVPAVIFNVIPQCFVFLIAVSVFPALRQWHSGVSCIDLPLRRVERIYAVMPELFSVCRQHHVVTLLRIGAVVLQYHFPLQLQCFGKCEIICDYFMGKVTRPVVSNRFVKALVCVISAPAFPPLFPASAAVPDVYLSFRVSVLVYGENALRLSYDFAQFLKYLFCLHIT